MTTIWKYPLRVADIVTLDMPAGARVLCVQVQEGTPCLWAVVNPKARTEERAFRVFSTGEAFDLGVNDDFIGSFQMDEGRLVFHVFDVS